MELKKVALKDLVSPEYNPREISEEEMAKLKRSITELGYSEPIIVNDVNNVIISGNQRYRALRELGTEEIEVIYIHEPVPAREKALNIALNKIDGDWDFGKLENIFSEMILDEFDTDLTGFDELEINNFLPNFDYELEPPRDLHTGNLEDYEDTKTSTKTYYFVPGEVWKIGSHELKIGEVPSSLKPRIVIFEEDMKISIEHYPNENPFIEFEEENQENEGLKPEALR